MKTGAATSFRHGFVMLFPFQGDKKAVLSLPGREVAPQRRKEDGPSGKHVFSGQPPPRHFHEHAQGSPVFMIDNPARSGYDNTKENVLEHICADLKCARAREQDMQQS